MKKMSSIGLTVLAAVCMTAACSLFETTTTTTTTTLSDAQKIVGNYWVSREIQAIYTNAGYYPQMSKMTNFPSKAASDSWLSIAAETMTMSDVTNGAVSNSTTYPYSLDPDAKTLTIHGDLMGNGVTNWTFGYVIGDGIVTVNTVYVTNMSVLFTMYMTNTLTRE